MIDVQKLLQPISGDDPCGPDGSYDPRFLELEKLAEGEPEHEIGGEIIEAKEPNWPTVREKCLEFLGVSRDLRAGVILCLAQTQLETFAGLRDGLAVLRGCVEQYWDGVHPRLDPEDNNDPTQRMNILANLASYDPPYRFIARFQSTPICSARGLGRVTLRDVLIADGKLTPGEGTGSAPLNRDQVAAVFRAAEPGALNEVLDCVAQSMEALDGIDAVFAEKLGSGRGPNFELLKRNLNDIRTQLVPYVGGFETAPEAVVGASPGIGPATGPSVEGPALAAGALRSREDVLRLLERICEYYVQAEPSSPVPYILKAAQRMVNKDFLHILDAMPSEARDWLRQMAEGGSSTDT